MFGWYSLEAYKNGDDEYIFLDLNDQQTFATLITETKHIPREYHLKYKDVVFSGEVLSIDSDQYNMKEYCMDDMSPQIFQSPV